jgi:hypothetical protein
MKPFNLTLSVGWLFVVREVYIVLPEFKRKNSLMSLLEATELYIVFVLFHSYVLYKTIHGIIQTLVCVCVFTLLDGKLCKNALSSSRGNPVCHVVAIFSLFLLAHI